MSTRARRPDPSTIRPAWAISLSLHGVAYASMLAFGAAHTTHAAWSASASSPMILVLRPDPHDALEPPVDLSAIPPVEAAVEDPPNDATTPIVDPMLMGEQAREPADEPVADLAAAAALPAPPVPYTAPDRVDWRAAIRRVPAASQNSVAAAGANVEASPQQSENEPPDYPFVAFRRGIEGSVTVLLEIDELGAVTAAHVELSSGCSQLDDAALRKLATWRFEPARCAGRAVRGSWRQVVVFRITH